MIALLSASFLELRSTPNPAAGTAALRILGASGEPVATVAERAGAARSLGRFLSRTPGAGAADLEVRDADGSLVLTLAKARVGARNRLHVDVALADGTPVGAGDGRLNARGSSFELFDESGARCGVLRDSRGQQFDLVDAGGAVAGHLHRWLTSVHGPLPAGVTRAYRVTFTDAAPVSLRALALGALIGLDQRLT